MAKDFKLPDLGEGIHEAQVVNVMIKEGDTVKEDQMVMEVETDKAAVELPVPFAGVISKLNVKQGDTVHVGDVLLSVDEAGKGASAAKAPAREEAPAPKRAEQHAPAKSAPARDAEEEETEEAPPRRAVERAPAARAPVSIGAPSTGPIPAAPAVRRLARESGIDLREVHGTGPGGRIVREDVERLIVSRSDTGVEDEAVPHEADRKHHAPPAPRRPEPVRETAERPREAAPAGSDGLPDFSQYGPVRREKVSQIRKTIARQMARAWSIPRVTHADEADVTDLELFRREHSALLAEKGAKLTLTALVIKAVAGALREFPAFNSSYDDAAGEIIFKEYIHIGVAVDSPRGLLVPVLRDVDRKGLMAISKELKDIADKAREFKVDVAQMRGGTFTVTNVGALGGTMATPMINWPEVAILGMGKLQDKPLVKDGQIVVRKMLPLFLSFDHRVIDGADAARFVRQVMGYLENPLNLLLAS